MKFSSIEEVMYWLLGLVGGCIAFINMPPALLHISTSFISNIHWQNIFEKTIQLLYAGIVALFCGGMGWLGKKMAEKFSKTKIWKSIEAVFKEQKKPQKQQTRKHH